MMSGVSAHSSSLLRAVSGEVHLWYATWGDSLGGELLGSYEALLQPEERRRYGALAVERRRREYLVTRALARCVLSRYYPVDPGDWRFLVDARGRPELDPPRGISFSLTNCAGGAPGAGGRRSPPADRTAPGSSSADVGRDASACGGGAAGLVACAVADRRVGVDAEPLSRAPAILDLGPRFLAEAEREALSRLDAASRAYRAITLWTLKEAYAKARGLGLALPFRSFSLAVDAGRAVLAGPPPCDDARWDLAVADVRSHRLAVAVERSGGPPVLRTFEMTPLAGEPREVGAAR
jgi:4'-phosphopantetheinyl transferase